MALILVVILGIKASSYFTILDLILPRIPIKYFTLFLFVANSNFGPGLETAPSFPKLCDECSVSHSGNPAHETYDKDLGLISTTGMYFRDERNSIVYPSRVVYNIAKGENGDYARNIFGEIEFEPIDLDRCWTDDHPGPGMELNYK